LNGLKLIQAIKRRRASKASFGKEKGGRQAGVAPGWLQNLKKKDVGNSAFRNNTRLRASEGSGRRKRRGIKKTLGAITAAAGVGYWIGQRKGRNLLEKRKGSQKKLGWEKDHTLCRMFTRGFEQAVKNYSE